MSKAIVQDEKMIRKTQLAELEILIEADRICRKNNIRYCINAGTLLGAVRHKGYIPWDNDTDIALTRREYEKFRKACRKDLNTKKFYFQDYRDTDGYQWLYGKLRMKNTVFQRPDQEHMPYDQGIGIDVFPMDGVPTNLILRSFQNVEAFFIRKLLYASVGKVHSKSFIGRFFYKQLDKIPTKFAFKWHENMRYRANNKKNNLFVRILGFPVVNGELGYLRRWYENVTEMEFEGHNFYAIKDYDTYLQFIFGDYMQYPQKKERVPVSVSRLEF